MPTATGHVLAATALAQGLVFGRAPGGRFRLGLLWGDQLQGEAVAGDCQVGG